MLESLRPLPPLLSNLMNYTIGNGKNGTASAIDTPDLLPSILETFIPGYGMIRVLVIQLLGLDVSVFLPIVAMLLALHAGSMYVFGYIRDALEQYCTCAVDMNEWDDPYEAIMRWLNEKNHFRKARYLRVAGRWWDRITARPEQALAMSEKLEIEAEGLKAVSRTPIFNTEAKKPPGFEPDEGKYYFWHNGRPFCLNLYFKEMKHREVNFHKVRLSCFGFSTGPLKDLIKEALSLDIEEEHMTDFYRPYPQDSEWKRVNSRPSRPLDTVTLDTAQKTKIVRDVNDFIHPARKQWYASRGIPYRRGYLFSGPPGTGKTSLSLALAGVFNLSLYAVSIQDPTMSDTRLTELFDDLPSQCIVLLEDIDSAGVVQARTNEKGPDDELSDASSDSEKNSGTKTKRQPKRSKVTLAGLLNAIDGVASHEGHLLIMTTNHPEKLDGALRRPGRVDLHIEFTMATTFQAREIFLRLFTDGKPVLDSKSQPDSSIENSTLPRPWSATSPNLSPSNRLRLGLGSRRPTTVEEACRERWELLEHQSCPFMSFSELQSLADLLAASIPDRVLSPAEIQGYLLLHKADPSTAAQGAKRWADETIQQKKDRAPKSVLSKPFEVNRVEPVEATKQANNQDLSPSQKNSRQHQRRKLQRNRITITDEGIITPGLSDEDKKISIDEEASDGSDSQSRFK